MCQLTTYQDFGLQKRQRSKEDKLDIREQNRETA